MCGMTHLYYVTWLNYMCDMTHLYVWYNSIICVTWLICIGNFSLFSNFYISSSQTGDSCIHVTGLIHMCDMTHLYVWHHSLICATWLNYMCDMKHSYVCDMTHSYVWQNPCTDSRLLHTCNRTQSYVWRNSFKFATWLVHTCDMTEACRTYKKVRSRIRVSHAAHLF